jgi:hypothetical protein
MLGWEFYCVCVALQLVSSANKQSICKRCCGSGSGIRCLFLPLDRGSGFGMGEKSRSGSGIRDEQPGSYFLELRNHIFGINI